MKKKNYDISSIRLKDKLRKRAIRKKLTPEEAQLIRDRESSRRRISRLENPEKTKRDQEINTTRRREKREEIAYEKKCQEEDKLRKKFMREEQRKLEEQNTDDEISASFESLNRN